MHECRVRPCDKFRSYRAEGTVCLRMNRPLGPPCVAIGNFEGRREQAAVLLL